MVVILKKAVSSIVTKIKKNMMNLVKRLLIVADIFLKVETMKMVFFIPITCIFNIKNVFQNRVCYN